MIAKKFPNKNQQCQKILTKKSFGILDVIEINEILFEKKSEIDLQFNQKHRAFDESSIHKILKYQRDNFLNNTQVALHFKLSRNTVSRWKKHFN
ncbi:helix-turn-helix domain-containing protein [Chryseobacterium balustinum]|uniref:helix-turn-helix domain-containing protein n=1 Tax=Chryseobacterium balustinum TaxID=246 RepID=UPI003CF3C571